MEFSLFGRFFASIFGTGFGWLLRGWWGRRKEYRDMMKRLMTKQTRLVLCGVFKKMNGDFQLEFDFLGIFRTTHFGETLFRIIDDWMRKKGPGVIVPDDKHAASHLREILRTISSSMLLQCSRIGPYLSEGGYGHPSYAYRYVKMVACLVSLPTAHATWEDLPCVLLVEQSMLERIRDCVVTPNPEEKDGSDMLQILQLVAERFFGNDREGITVFTTPIDF
jgi:hypothetical protein